MELKVRINKLYHSDAYIGIEHLLKGMIVEMKDKMKDNEYYDLRSIYFNEQQIEFLKQNMPQNFRYKHHFNNHNHPVIFKYSKNCFLPADLNIKCSGCDNKIKTSVCPHCGEWN